jgi:adenine-specific DNA-methyltransferase
MAITRRIEVANLSIDTPEQSLIWSSLLAHVSRISGRSPRDLAAPIAQIMGDPPGLLARLLAAASSDAAPLEPAAAQRALSDPTRRAHGVYFTPAEVAQALVALVPSLEPAGAVVDLSAGAGALLVAAIARWPERRVVAVERDETLALACACALWAARDGLECGDRVMVGDGLSAQVAALLGEGGAALVVANPPYLGEKGRAQQFAALRAAHPHLEPWWGARQDLLYLFLHRGLDLLAPGGWMVALTSAYWLQATGARRLRADLVERARVEALVSVERRLFEDAPGHHSLLCAVQRGGAQDAGAAVLACDALPPDWEVLAQAPRVALARDGSPWALWSSGVDVRGWTPLGELVRDCQGFVSGLDRVTARHVRELEALGLEAPAVGAPGFLFRREEVPEALWEGARRWLRPLLRAHMIVAGGELVEACWDEVVLYVDGEVEVASEREVIEAQLGPLRPLLERRREVERGRMGWTRLHWPRRLADQLGPKLVVPRRAASACFMLDLSGSAVSSDCTYLVAAPGVEDVVGHLRRVQAALGSEEVGRVLQASGKRKGELLEFYAEPLRGLTLPWG